VKSVATDGGPTRRKEASSLILSKIGQPAEQPPRGRGMNSETRCFAKHARGNESSPRTPATPLSVVSTTDSLRSEQPYPDNECANSPLPGSACCANERRAVRGSLTSPAERRNLGEFRNRSTLLAATGQMSVLLARRRSSFDASLTIETTHTSNDDVSDRTQESSNHRKSLDETTTISSRQHSPDMEEIPASSGSCSPAVVSAASWGQCRSLESTSASTSRSTSSVEPTPMPGSRSSAVVEQNPAAIMPISPIIKPSQSVRKKYDPIVDNNKKILHLGSGEKIYDLFSWEEVMQEEGDGGKVVVCRAKTTRSWMAEETGAELVMKICPKCALFDLGVAEDFRRIQLRMLSLPPHDGVMPFLEVLEDHKFYYSVMERAAAGPLFDALLNEFVDGTIPTPSVKKVLREILGALRHLHENGILHRDIKPDNLVVQVGAEAETFLHSDASVRQAWRVMLIDFDHVLLDWQGVAQSPSMYGDFAGTPRFSAPEALLGNYSPQSDLYSVGVVLYLLMTGKMPRDDDIFEQEMEKGHSSSYDRSWRIAIQRRLQDIQVDWCCDPWPAQPLCKAFCMSLLSYKPSDRPRSAEQALEHDWLAQPTNGL